MMTLAQLGWDDAWAEAAETARAGLGIPDLVVEPARVAIEHRGAYEVVSVRGIGWAELRGKDYFAARDKRQLPTVGDWVLIAGGEAGGASVIHALLPRRSCLIRAAAGEKVAPQTIAANVDIAFVVTSANLDLNARRIERYLTAVRDGGATPVIVLNKVDLVDDPAALLARLAEVAPGVAVVPASAARGDGLDHMIVHLRDGARVRTAVVIGSSGVGKSTLLNRLLGEAALEVQPVRAHDDRGKHTTTRRELFVLTDGGVVVDTPGMRELKPWNEAEAGGAPDDGDALAFDDIAALAPGCRFADCRHQAEPGCAVRDAVARGGLAADRLASWHKLGREQGERSAAADAADKRRDKVAARSLRSRLRDKNRKD